MKYLFLILCLFSGVVGAEDLPMPGGGDIRYDGNDLYKWDTANFIVLGVKDLQGYEIAQQIESIKSWAINRWGLPTEPFITRAKIICVPDNATLKKLFRLDSSFAESRPREDVCWVICDKGLTHAISIFVTEFCISNFERIHKIKVGYWARRGMSILNGDLHQVKIFVAPLSGYIASDSKLFFSKSLFTCNKELLLKSSVENISLFDRESVLLCLMLRKEFGQANFLALITDSSVENVRRITGFSDYSEFDKAFKRYLYYAATDAAQGRMSNSYLTITRVVY